MRRFPGRGSFGPAKPLFRWATALRTRPPLAIMPGTRSTPFAGAP